MCGNNLMASLVHDIQQSCSVVVRAACSGMCELNNQSRPGIHKEGLNERGAKTERPHRGGALKHVYIF